MMNKRFDWMGVDERKHLYYQMLGYWGPILKKYKPDLIVFTAVPHAVYDYLVYELAQLWNIRTIMFDSTLLGDRYLYMNDFRVGCLDFQEVLLKNLINYDLFVHLTILTNYYI